MVAGKLIREFIEDAFCLSELTGQTLPVVTRISLLIKTIQPDQSNPEQYARKRWVFKKKPLEKADFIFKLTGPAMVRPPVLTNGKRS